MAASLDPRTHVGTVGLSVADLDRSLAYYTAAIGLDLQARGDGRAVLGVPGRPLVELHEEPGAERAETTAGLFHLALLLPTRRDLAAWLQHAIDAQIRIDGLGDHVVSEAVYLTDPDGHGIEVYADRDRATWDGRVAELMGTFAVDVPSLLAELDGPQGDYAGLPAGTTMGHVHLRVADIPTTTRFHRDVIGWDAVMDFGPSATFLSAGGYHHHIGANTWQSAGQRAGRPGEARLLFATIVVPDETERDALLERVRADGGTPVEDAGGWRVEDPSGVPLRVAVAD